MTIGSDLADGGEPVPPDARKVRTRGRWVLAGAGLVALVLGGVWGTRDRIAADLIDRELTAMGLPAHYRIESIGLGREVIAAVVVGDPAHPDLTIERMEIALRYGATGPVIDRITMVRPRLYGRLIDGQVHLGALDKVLYAPSSGAPLRLPDWTLALVDARGRIDSAFGQLGFSADGTGRLSDGFAGTLGVVVPQAHFGSCLAGRTTLFGKVSSHAGRPRIDGPLRLDGLRCADTRMAPGTVDLAVASDKDLANWTIGGHLALGRIERGQQGSLARLGGDAGLRWQAGQGDLSGRVTLDAHGIAAPMVRLGDLHLDGVVHARQGFSTLDFRGDIDGRSLARGVAAQAALDRARAGVAGTPLAPLLARMAVAVTREEPGSRLSGAMGLHADSSGWRLAVPSLALRGGHLRQTIAQVDQFTVAGGDGNIPRVAGNFATRGADLPAITGKMTAGGGRGARFQLAMAPYTAGGAALAVPDMAVTQAGDGTLGFAGTAAVSGPLGGQMANGRVDGLVLPVDGGLSGAGQLALFRQCVTPRFDRLRAGTLELVHGAVKVCPVGGAAVRVGPRGAVVSASLPALTLQGRAGDAPLLLHAGAAHVTWPGTSMLNAVDVTLGKGADANHVALASATIAPTGGAFGGRITGGDASLAALPATVDAAAGDWRLDGGRLTLTGGSFVLTDRTVPARFVPIGARDVTVAMADGAVTATTRLIAPRVGEELARVQLRHDLGSGKGHADVTIAGLTFREKGSKPNLQPSDLTDLTKGLFAIANGTIVGNAKFDWNTNAKDGGLASSGRFSSDDFDFAGYYGPVEGVAGTIEFTDLIHMVSAPHQHLKIASINPGIEVVNGAIDLDLHENQVVRLNHAQWPFDGGTLNLEPAELHFDVVEPRKLTLIVTGLAAGRFLQHINMSNLSASGTFDGRLPLVFDANGGRITGGRLDARAPGGNVSYVGALSYRDLTPMANFAFKMLRSVDYHAMTIGLEGDLGGEVVTSVSFGGISQGKGAERNLITRQLSRLPLRFDINVRSQFRHLIGTLSSLYDPTLVPDPRSLGLVDAQGRPLHHHGSVTVGAPSSAASSGGAIQPPASGTMP